MAAYCIGTGGGGAPAARRRSSSSTMPGAGTPAEVWTFAELEEAVLRIAAGLKAAGLAPGARILIRLENTSTYALLFFGAIAGGFVPLPTSTQLTEREARFLLEDSGAEAIALGARSGARRLAGRRAGLRGRRDCAHDRDGPARRLRRYRRRRPGLPDLHLRHHGQPQRRAARPALRLRAAGPCIRAGTGSAPDDRMLHAGAFNWTFTLGTGLTDPWANGATAIIYTGEKDASAVAAPHRADGRHAVRRRAGPLPADPQVRGARRRRPRRALRHGLIAGETPPPGLFEEWTERTGRALYEALGMSEISTYVSIGPERAAQTRHRRQAAAGPPRRHPRARRRHRAASRPARKACSPCTAPIRGSCSATGTGRRRRRTSIAATGSSAATSRRWTPTATSSHRGRANDLMKALGYRVSPLEVETVLLQHPAVAEVACAEVRVRADVSVIARLHRAAAERASSRHRRDRALRRRAARRLQAPARVRVRRGAAAHGQRQAHALAAEAA